MEHLFLAIIIITLLVGVILVVVFSKKKHLGESKKSYYRKEIQKVSTLPSPTERIMRYDMIMHHILSDYGYTGTVGDQLKAKPRIIRNLDTIWNLHKLRNKLAHDMETVSNGLLEKKAQEFEKEVLGLL